MFEPLPNLEGTISCQKPRTENVKEHVNVNNMFQKPEEDDTFLSG